MLLQLSVPSVQNMGNIKRTDVRQTTTAQNNEEETMVQSKCFYALIGYVFFWLFLFS